ncbi:MAG: hypothetical protein IKC02_02490, partial [Oscillospiraceae bacterium]|nr:hypothetical protein [Oscillospiraceae bacterium]
MGGISRLGGVSDDIVKAISGVENGILKFALKTGWSAVKEGSEEALQAVLEPIFKSIVTGDKLDIDWSEVAYDALMGMLTGGVFETPGNAAATIKNIVTEETGHTALEGEKIQVERDEEGIVTVVIDADILAGKPKTEWRTTISNELKRIFQNGILLPRGTIYINKKGRGEFTNGSYTKMLERTDPSMHQDKMRMALGADVLLQNAENTHNEIPAHARDDDIVSFNRGNIRVRV